MYTYTHMCVCLVGVHVCVFSWHCKTQTQNFHSSRAPRLDFSQPLGATSPTLPPLHPLGRPSPPAALCHRHATDTEAHMQPKRSAPCSLTCYFRFRIRFVCCRRRNLTKSHVANVVLLRHTLSRSLLPLKRAFSLSLGKDDSIRGGRKASAASSGHRNIGASAHRHILGHRLQMAASFVSFSSVTNSVSKRSVAAFKELVLPKGTQIRNSCFVLIFAKFRAIFYIGVRVCTRGGNPRNCLLSSG